MLTSQWDSKAWHSDPFSNSAAATLRTNQTHYRWSFFPYLFFTSGFELQKVISDITSYWGSKAWHTTHLLIMLQSILKLMKKTLFNNFIPVPASCQSLGKDALSKQIKKSITLYLGRTLHQGPQTPTELIMNLPANTPLSLSLPPCNHLLPFWHQIPNLHPKSSVQCYLGKSETTGNKACHLNNFQYFRLYSKLSATLESHVLHVVQL